MVYMRPTSEVVSIDSQDIISPENEIPLKTNMFAKLLILTVCCTGLAYCKPSVAFGAPLAFAAAPAVLSAPIVTSRSSQVVQRNFNAFAAPFFAAAPAAPIFAAPAPVVAAAPAIAAPAPVVAPAPLSSPLFAPAYGPAPILAPAKYFAPAPFAAPYAW